MTRANEAGQNIPEKKLADRTKKADPQMTKNHVTKEQLEKLIDDLTETDEKIKTGLMDATDGIERLIASI